MASPESTGSSQWRFKPYQDPHDPQNGSAYHTGKPCITQGCTNPAGTRWSPLWCHPCNVERMDRLNRQWSELAASFGISWPAREV